MAYAELHAHSAYSFLDGASLPEELAVRAAELGYEALALTDHDGVYGSLEFAHAAKAFGVRPITGAEVALGDGSHVTLLVERARGYANLCRLLTAAHAGTRPKEGERGALDPELDQALLEELNDGLVCLSGCSRFGLGVRNPNASARLARAFGRERFFVELQRPFERGDVRRNAGLRGLAEALQVETVVTGDVHAHAASRAPLQDAMVAIRHRTSLEGSEPERRGNHEAVLRPPGEVAGRFPLDRDAVERTALVAERCEFDLTQELGYRYPDFSDGAVPAITRLAEVCNQAFSHRYSEASNSLLLGARARLDEELALIDEIGLAGFFLLHYEVLELAREVAVEVRGRESPRKLAAAWPGPRVLRRVDRLLPDRALACRPGRGRPLAGAVHQPGTDRRPGHRPRLPTRHPREADRRSHGALRTRARCARRELLDVSVARRDPRHRQGARASRTASSSGSRGSPTAGTRSASPRSSGSSRASRIALTRPGGAPSRS